MTLTAIIITVLIILMYWCFFPQIPSQCKCVSSVAFFNSGLLSDSWVAFLLNSFHRFHLQIAGNKMTSWNLATIFGPNLLHKTKNSDKEFAVESVARAEESVAVINVLQRLIESHDALFTVSRAHS